MLLVAQQPQPARQGSPLSPPDVLTHTLVLHLLICAALQTRCINLQCWESWTACVPTQQVQMSPYVILFLQVTLRKCNERVDWTLFFAIFTV